MSCPATMRKNLMPWVCYSPCLKEYNVVTKTELSIKCCPCALAGVAYVRNEEHATKQTLQVWTESHKLTAVSRPNRPSPGEA